jgi:LysR family transcriptional regulator for metE and metH
VDARLDVRHLRLIQAIADEGGVTHAARRLHLTQSALSRQLRDAEERLGAPLFLRVRKKMLLTPAGEELLASARRILAELERAEGRIQSLGAGETGTLRLATECYTCYHWLPPLLRAFQQRHPGVDVRIELGATHRTVAALLDGSLDVGIVSSEPRDPRLERHPLFEDEMVIVLSSGHPLSRRPHLRPKDLAGETVLVYPPRADSLLVHRILAPAGIAPRRVMEVPLTEAVLEMAAAGMGVGFLARWAVPPRRKRGGLVTRPLGKAGYHRRWSAARLRSGPRPRYLDEFLRLLARMGPGRPT